MGRFVQQFAAPVAVDLAPEFLGSIRNLDRALDLCGRCIGHFADSLLGGRVDDGMNPAAFAWHQLGVDQVAAAKNFECC